MNFIICAHPPISDVENTCEYVENCGGKNLLKN